jgi:hypothetical protein
MGIEYKNIIDRCGTYAELSTNGQLLEGQAGFCTDRHSILYRRRSTEVDRPSEIDEFRCTGFRNPIHNTTGIRAILSPSHEDHEWMFEIVNDWAGMLMASADDVNGIGLPFPGFLNDKLTGGDPEITLDLEKTAGAYSPEVLKIKFGGLKFLGSWGVGVAYKTNNLVSFDGNVYINILAYDSVPESPNPSADPTHWALFASQGGSGAYLSLNGSNFLTALATEPTYNKGKLFYLEPVQSVVVQGNREDSPLVMNRQMRILVKNMSGATIPKGRAVYPNGHDSGLPTIALAQANSSATSFVSGITMYDIPHEGVGEIMGGGALPLDLTGIADNAQMWLSDTTAGLITTTAPVFPNFLTYVGRAFRGGANGILLVEKSTLPTIAPSSGGGDAGGQYAGVQTFILSLISQAVNIFGGNAQIWTAVITPYDTQIDKMAAFVTQSQESSETMRFGVCDINGNLIAQTDTLSTAHAETYRRPDSTGVKILSFPSPVALTRNTIYYFTVAGKINGIAFGGYSGMATGSPAIALSYTSINARYDDGVTGIYPTMQSHYPESSRAWMMGFRA